MGRSLSGLRRFRNWPVHLGYRLAHTGRRSACIRTSLFHIRNRSARLRRRVPCIGRRLACLLHQLLHIGYRFTRLRGHLLRTCLRLRLRLPRTASAPPMRSASSRCGTAASWRWRTRQRCCCPVGRRTPPGTCVTCVMEGARPVLAEIQALAVSSPAGNPRRTSNGFDYNRFAMLLAVLEKRGGLKVSACDAYLNIIGGLEPGRARRGSGGGDRPGLQLSGPPVPADLWPPGGGPHRRAAVRQPAGPAGQRGPAGWALPSA